LDRLQWSPDVSTARIAFCDSPNGPAVLKVSIEPEMIEREAMALSHFGGTICPEVFQVDPSLEAILMQRIEAIEDLSAWYPDPEREVAAWLSIYDQIVANRSIPEGFPTLETFGEVFDRVLEKPLRADVEEIMRIGRDRRQILMGEPSENRLLHGDLHHFNLLRDTSERWRLIDPHGVVGHPLYELGAFLRNPWGACYTEPGVNERLEARVSILAQRMELPVSVVAEYGFYGAAFSIAWSLEDDVVEDGMAVMAEACLNLVRRHGL
jgi:streptomycin 6-kinase